jgi:pentafunctional AROM polypeptide
LFGKPISASRSPALHNRLFQDAGLPHRYDLFETDNVADVRTLLSRKDFGGASVTIPLKLDIMGELDELTEAAKVIGAVNTIIPTSGTNEAGRKRLLGDNTDWQGMVYTLRNAGVKPQSGGTAAMVIGCGGTARAAIFALKSLNFESIHVVARNPTKAEELIASFPNDYGLQLLPNKAAVADKIVSPLLAVISTIPADRPLDSTVRETLSAALGQSPASSTATRALLEMAYKPRQTEAMQLAQDAGDWKAIPGLEVLAAQGWYQYKLWTGVQPLYAHARSVVLGE